MSRGNAKQIIFKDGRDYDRYLQLLERSLDRFAIRCLAYCLLRNHLHLLLQPSDYPISRMMQHVNSAYCQWFNRRHRRVGHVLQGRYKAVFVEKGDSFLRVLRYIAMNPVHAKCVGHPAAWQWSSYRATAGIDLTSRCVDVHAVWQAFNAADSHVAQLRFAECVTAEGCDPPSPRGLFIGSDAFVRRFEPMLQPHRNTRAFVYAERYSARPSLSDLFSERVPTRSAAVTAHHAFNDHAYTLREIGLHLKRPPATVWSWIRQVSAMQH